MCVMEESMTEEKNNKIERVLGIYTRLLNGSIVKKSEEAANYGVNERSIQRDIDDIRNYLELDGERVGCINNVVYDRVRKGYRLEQVCKMKLSNSEVETAIQVAMQKVAAGADPADELKTVQDVQDAQ